MTTSTARATDVLTDVARERARAEARELDAMLAYREAELARTERVEPAMRRQVERSAIAMTIGQAMGFSEGQVHHLLSSAQTVRNRAPKVWAAFCDGLIDRARIRDVAHTIDQLGRDESIDRLDRRVVGYAIDHTAAELRIWLRRFVQRVEADLAVERADAERAERHVSIRHADDGWGGSTPTSRRISWPTSRSGCTPKPAAPPTPMTTAPSPNERPTSWSHGAPTPEAATSVTDVHVAVTIDADVLAGARQGFAESTDGRWAVPASWITEIALTGNAFWHRMVLDPVNGDVHSHEYVGRFCPDVLSVALRFRDGVCQAPGCLVPAELCDIDHRTPFPAGATRADNLGPFCRRHHGFKGHGLLKWSIGPPPKRPPVVIENYAEPLLMEYAA